MKITCISDTHGHHLKLTKFLTGGDLLIHSGDVTEFGTKSELEDFIYWFSKLNYPHKVFIGGNHDLFLESSRLQKNLGDGIVYLQNESALINGYKVWGSPVSPYFLGMAFNEKRGESINKVWKQIPLNTDILITHTPPFSVLDNNLGCSGLGDKIQDLKLKLHTFGHIHVAYGVIEKNSTTFINASMVNTKGLMDLEHKVINTPITVYLE